MKTLNFADRLKSVIIAVNGQGTLARILGAKASTVGSWAQGKGRPSLEKIHEICLKTGFSSNWLAFGEGEVRPGEGQVAQAAGGGFLGHSTEPQGGKRGRLTSPPMDAGAAFTINALGELAEQYKHRIKELESRGGVQSETLPVVGLAECGVEGWLQKQPLTFRAECPPGMQPESDFAVVAVGESMFYEGIKPGFTCYCSPRSAAVPGDAVYVLGHEDRASIGLVVSLAEKERGEEWLVLKKWHDPDKKGRRASYLLKTNLEFVQQIAPVIYVHRRTL